MKTKITITILIVALNSVSLVAQFVYGPSTSDLRRNLYSIDYGEAQSSGLLDPTTNIMVGTRNYTGGPEDDRIRALYQWNLDDSKIPDNSEIISINLSFDYDRLHWDAPSMNAYFFSIDDDITDPDLQQIFDYMFHPREMFSAEETSYNKFNLTFNDPEDPDFIAFSNAINASLINDRFTLGIRECPSCRVLYVMITNTVKLTIEFIPPTTPVIIDQRLSNNQQVGVLKKWEENENDWSESFNPGSQFYFQVFSPQTILGDQTIQSNEKYNNWNFDKSDVRNHHTFTITSETSELTSRFDLTLSGITIKNSLEGTTFFGGDFQFFDPWYIDFQDGAYGNSWRNRGMEEPHQFYNRSVGTSGWQPDFTTVYQQGPYAYNGVFLNQGWPNWEPPYYSVKVNLTQDITLYSTGNSAGRSHKFYFRNWSYDANKISLQTPGSNETAVVFKTSDAELSANLKGTNLSDDTKAYNTTSQRKIVKIPDLDGTLHSVYSSNNRIWYEMSTDNGATWSLLNNGQPIDDSQGKLPSIDYVQLLTYPAELDCWVTIIVYQESYGSGFKIKAKSFRRIDDGPYIYKNMVVLDTYSNESYANNANPVLAIDNAGIITFVWERKSSPAGLYCRRATINVNTQYNDVLVLYDLYNSKKLGNINYSTSASSINPSITVSKTVYPGPNGSGRHLAWQDYNEIKYATIAVTNQQEGITLGTIETPSYASGYPLNYLPSLSLANGKPVLSWTGYSDGNITKITSEQEDLIRKRALVKVRGDLGWGSLTELGDNINYVNNNSVTSASEKTVIVWSQGTTPQSKWVKRSAAAYSNICNLSHSGIENQVTMGSDFNNMYAMVFNNQTTPLYFIKSTTNFSAECASGGINKITYSDSIISYGRSGIVSKNGVEFVFNTGDVFVSDSSVQFTFVPDTLLFNSAEELNIATRTENFWLEEEVDFFFSNLYYVLNHELADSVLTEQDQVNFKVELVKAQSGDVVGTFDNITYNKSNLEKYASIHYLVNTSGIQAGEYYLRLVISVAGEAGYNLSNIQRDEFDLNKLHYVNVSFKGETIPVTYELSQNYPNPFNPTTTIRYQLPNDGMVTLKVYDILGAEVATLVNEEMVAGKHEVNFNASSLASGVYIYRINVNDYTNVKKMVLLK